MSTGRYSSPFLMPTIFPIRPFLLQPFVLHSVLLLIAYACRLILVASGLFLLGNDKDGLEVPPFLKEKKKINYDNL